ncbi:MAG: PIN domain-containing protein [Mycetocola sp.]
MTLATSRGAVVIDTDVYGAELTGSPLALRYRSVIAGRPVFISFQTEAELRFGALLRGWGKARMLQLEARLAAVETVHSGPDLINTYARLRTDCWRVGHALAQKEHDADRWVAATAIRLGIPLVANDRIYDNAPGLQVERPTDS